VLVTGPTVTGPGSANFTVSGLKPGTYFFHCQYHPTQMKGTIVVR
jgi:plastocyanin